MIRYGTAVAGPPPLVRARDLYARRRASYLAQGHDEAAADALASRDAREGHREVALTLAAQARLDRT